MSDRGGERGLFARTPDGTTERRIGTRPVSQTICLVSAQWSQDGRFAAMDPFDWKGLAIAASTDGAILHDIRHYFTLLCDLSAMTCGLQAVVWPANTPRTSITFMSADLTAGGE